MPASKERVAIKKEKGICIKCIKPARKNKLLCEKCAKLVSRIGKKYYYKLRELGLCTSCGQEPAESEKTQCKECADSANKLGQKRRRYKIEKGECIQCSKKAVIDKTLCELHLAIQRERSKERREKTRALGLCYCGRERALNRMRCEQCLKRNKKFSRGASRKRAYDGNRWKALERDNHTCQICGIKKKRMTVHHIDGNGGHNSNEPNHNLDNLISLCQRCHNAFNALAYPGKNVRLAVSILEQYAAANDL